MDYAEFHELVESTIHGMYDRIPAKYHDGFEDLFTGGELRLAVDDLVGGLTRHNVQITPAERANLTRILEHLKEPDSRLDGIAVTGDDGV